MRTLHLYPFLLGGLSGDEDNTVGSSGAIKCGSGRAFQDRNVFNIIRVEGGQYVTIVVTTPFACTFQFRIVHRHAVDDI